MKLQTANGVDLDQEVPKSHVKKPGCITCYFCYFSLVNKGLVSNYGEGGGGGYKRGHVKFKPYKKGGGLLNMLRGVTIRFEVVFIR